MKTSLKAQVSEKIDERQRRYGRQFQIVLQ